jgi:hypothetical protein
MTAEEFLKLIKEFQESNPNIVVSKSFFTKYDPLVSESKSSFVFFEKNQIGILKKFKIIIEESIPPTNS